MTRTELRILSPIASELRLAHPHDWWSLKYQTQFGPEFDDWPHFVAALEFVRPAEEAVHGLPRSAKSLLVAEWRSKPRDRSVTPIEAVLDRYASMIIEVLVKRAVLGFVVPRYEVIRANGAGPRAEGRGRLFEKLAWLTIFVGFALQLADAL